MILSVSRRTDIPNYYSEWFYNRIKEGYLYVRNPMNAHQISKIILSPEVVDCIVFWTKNPEPMFSRLDELEAYQYYFQFTLTGFGNDIECNVPHKKEHMIPVFQKLAKRIGKQKMIWRYDPIIFTDKYTPEYHLKAFRQIAEELKNQKVVGWFQGRMEYGPRALGNRSILGDPRSEKMQSLLNLKIKIYRYHYKKYYIYGEIKMLFYLYRFLDCARRIIYRPNKSKKLTILRIA